MAKVMLVWMAEPLGFVTQSRHDAKGKWTPLARDEIFDLRLTHELLTLRAVEKYAVVGK